MRRRAWTPPPRAAEAVEMLDRPVPFGDLCASLDDVARLNGLFGGRRVVLRHVRRLLERLPPEHAALVLDLGTGGGDIPVALVRWARRAGRRVRVIALDRDGATLRAARRLTAGYPEIVGLQGDLLALPLRPGSVDVAMCSLTLHHLAPAEAAGCLAAMDRVSRLGFVVNDLVRGRAAWTLVWLATRLFARSAMSRHDGPLSVRRSYSSAEVADLCARAGVAGVRVLRYPLLLRHCAVRVKAGPAAERR